MDSGVGLIEVRTTSNGVRNDMASFLSLVLSWEFLWGSYEASGMAGVFVGFL